LVVHYQSSSKSAQKHVTSERPEVAVCTLASIGHSSSSSTTATTAHLTLLRWSQLLRRRLQAALERGFLYHLVHLRFAQEARGGGSVDEPLVRDGVRMRKHRLSPGRARVNDHLL
jgi:hypothetical protein